MTSTPSLCRHCRTRKAPPPPNTRRGLCWSCSTDPEIREMYPTTSKYRTRVDFIVPAGVTGPLTCREIGELVGLSTKRVHQIEVAAVAKLRLALAGLRRDPAVLAMAADCGVDTRGAGA